MSLTAREQAKLAAIADGLAAQDPRLAAALLDPTLLPEDPQPRGVTAPVRRRRGLAVGLVTAAAVALLALLWGPLPPRSCGAPGSDDSHALVGQVDSFGGGAYETTTWHCRPSGPRS